MPSGRHERQASPPRLPDVQTRSIAAGLKYGKAPERRNASARGAFLHRVRAEFLEMPGLCLTFAQSQRLFALREDVCRRVLDHLVDTGFLRCTPRGSYVRRPETP